MMLHPHIFVLHSICYFSKNYQTIELNDHDTIASKQYVLHKEEDNKNTYSSNLVPLICLVSELVRKKLHFQV